MENDILKQAALILGRK